MPLRSWPSLVFAFAVLFIVVVFPTITPSKRRSLRRGRATARRQWFLFAEGLILLNQDQLQRIYIKLARHHSFDPKLLTRIKAAMGLQPCKSVRPPQQEGSPHVCFVQAGFCISTTGMAARPNHMAHLGSTAEGEGTACKQYQVSHFESNRSHRSNR